MQNVKKERYHLTFGLKILMGLLVVMAVLCAFNPQAYHSEIIGREDVTATPGWSFLQEGDYVLEVTYENSAENNAVIIYSDEIVGAGNQIGENFTAQDIPAGSGVVQMSLHLEQGTHQVQVKTVIENDASLITELQIQSVGLQNRDSYFLAGIFLLAMAILFLLGRFVPTEKYKMPLILVGLGLAASMPLFNDFLISGHDLEFHLTRIEGLYQSLRAGEIIARINPIQTSSFGSLTGAMYPQLFLYFPAVLRLMGVSLMMSYKALAVGMNIMTAFLGYYAVKNITQSSKIGFVASILYTFSVYRIANLYQRGALGESLALIFLPLVMWGIYEILWGDKKRWYLLTLGVTCVIQSHVLSVEICILFLVLEGIAWLVTGSRKELMQRFLAGIKATVLTVLLNLYFLIPFLYFYMDGTLQVFYMESTAADSVAYFSQMFSLFPTAMGINLEKGSTGGEMTISVGLVLLIGAVIFTVLASGKKARSGAVAAVGKRCLIYGISGVFLSSWLMPWEKIMENGLLAKLAGSLQFPWRLLGIASLFLCVTAAIGYVWLAEEQGRTWVYGIVAVLVITSTVYYFDKVSQESTQHEEKMLLEGVSVTDGLYMYGEGDTFQLFHLNYGYEDAYIKTALGTPVTYSEYSKSGTHIHVHVVPGEQADDYILFPLYYYPGYEVRINGEKTEVQVLDKQVTCKMPLEEADIDVVYSGLPAFRFGDIITFITLICVLCYNGALFAKKKRRKAV